MIYDQVQLLPGLMPAVFSGISFDMPDTSTEPGRRIAEHLFPGVDAAAYDDFGKAPNQVQVSGVLLGDDYIAKAKALQAAFEAPGPATLIHPWLGPMSVIMQEPASISFSNKELRVARFTATFTKVTVGKSSAGGLASTASSVLKAALKVNGLAGKLLSKMSLVIKTATVFKAALRTGRLFASYLTRAVFATAVIRSLFPTINTIRNGVSSIISLASAPFVTSLPSTPDELSERLVTFQEVVLAQVPEWVGTPAVAPADEAEDNDNEPLVISSPAAVFFASVELADHIAGEIVKAPSPVDRACLLAACAVPLALAANVVVYVEHKDRRSAIKARSSFQRVVDKAIDEATPLLETPMAEAAAQLTLAIDELAFAVSEDISETIGRLPSVITLQLQQPTDAFVIAAHLYGDTPELIEEGYRAIVARNDPRHPAQVEAGLIEVLL